LSCQQKQEPVYVNGLFAGAYITEFAANGSNKDAITELEPYIQKGKVYFLCPALPISTGNIKQGFEFTLDLKSGNFISSPRVRGIYRGSQNTTITANQPCIAAGYAERGKITITHFFPDRNAAEEWAKTVKLANK
jgi:hypothetical protein